MENPDDSKNNNSPESNVVTSKHNLKSREDILFYWTSARMASAVPVGLERPAPGEEEEDESLLTHRY